jgi:hypothetical protein
MSVLYLAVQIGPSRRAEAELLPVFSTSGTKANFAVRSMAT